MLFMLRLLLVSSAFVSIIVVRVVFFIMPLVCYVGVDVAAYVVVWRCY